MKTCSRCGYEKPLEDFGKLAKAPDGLQYYCKKCKAEVHQEKKHIRNKQINNARTRRIMENRKRIYTYLLKNPCACGEGDPIVLEFDHNDGVVKVNEISRMLADGCGWASIEEEIAKCTVRCANCHKRRTAEQFKYWKWTDCLYVKTDDSFNAIIGWPGLNLNGVSMIEINTNTD